jgi:hypothetical protein
MPGSRVLDGVRHCSAAGLRRSATRAHRHQLKDAAIAHEVPFFKDLKTDRLPLLTGDPEHDGRYGDTALARAVSLPLAAGALEDGPTRERLVRPALRVQIGAAKTFPPFFVFKSLDDPWLTTSLLCLDTARFLAPRIAMSAWISVPLSALWDGTLLRVIPLYARKLDRGADVVITVGEFNQSAASSTSLSPPNRGSSARNTLSRPPIVDSPRFSAGLALKLARSSRAGRPRRSGNHAPSDEQSFDYLRRTYADRLPPTVPRDDARGAAA